MPGKYVKTNSVTWKTKKLQAVKVLHNSPIILMVLRVTIGEWSIARHCSVEISGMRRYQKQMHKKYIGSLLSSAHNINLILKCHTSKQSYQKTKKRAEVAVFASKLLFNKNPKGLALLSFWQLETKYLLTTSVRINLVKIAFDRNSCMAPIFENGWTSVIRFSNQF